MTADTRTEISHVQVSTIQHSYDGTNLVIRDLNRSIAMGKTLYA